MIGVSPDVVERVRMEYLEMPGLALTCCQARRLFSLDAGVCEDTLAKLVGEHFLMRTDSGLFLRRATGRDLLQTRPLGAGAGSAPPICRPAEWI